MKTVILAVFVLLAGSYGFAEGGIQILPQGGVLSASNGETEPQTTADDYMMKRWREASETEDLCEVPDEAMNKFKADKARPELRGFECLKARQYEKLVVVMTDYFLNKKVYPGLKIAITYFFSSVKSKYGNEILTAPIRPITLILDLSKPEPNAQILYVSKVEASDGLTNLDTIQHVEPTDQNYYQHEWTFSNSDRHATNSNVAMFRAHITLPRAPHLFLLSTIGKLGGNPVYRTFGGQEQIPIYTEYSAMLAGMYDGAIMVQGALP